MTPTTTDKNPNLTLLEAAISASRIARERSIAAREAERDAIRAADDWAESRASVILRVGDILAPHPCAFSGAWRSVVSRVVCRDYRLLGSQDPEHVVVWVRWIKRDRKLSMTEQSFGAWRSAEVVGRYQEPKP